MHAKSSHVFRCCCFIRRRLKAPSAFLVLPRVHSQIYVFVRASTGDDLIYEPDQAQGFAQDIQRGIPVSILRELVIRTLGVLAEKNPIRQLHIFPLPAATVAGLTGRKEAVYFDHLSAALFNFAR